MTLLAKIAQGILTGAKAFIGFAPILSAVEPKYAGLIGTGTSDLTSIADLVVQVQTIAANLSANGTTLTGEQKMQMLLPLAYQAVVTSNLVANKKIGDPALLQTGVGQIAQGVFNVVASMHPDVADQVTAAALKT